jgi:SnoaL-like domain
MTSSALSVLAALLATATFAVCGDDETDAPSSAATAGPKASASASGGARAGGLVREHLAAVGRNDLDTYLSAVAEDARFDIGGREFGGRDAIREFFEGELSGGRYEVLRERPSTGGVTFDLNFRRGGLFEELTYAYIVEDGRISELLARYR